MSIRVVYPNIKGRAEPIRLALTIGGIEFEDDRVKFDDLPVMRKKGELPFGSFPVMVIDGKTYAQSNALLRYCGVRAGLYPKDPVHALEVDGVVDALEDVLLATFKDSSEKARKQLVEETIPKFFDPIEKMLSERDGPFLLGQDMSIADLKLYVSAGFYESGNIDHVPKTILEKYVNVMKAIRAVGNNEKVAEWNAAHA